MSCLILGIWNCSLFCTPLITVYYREYTYSEVVRVHRPSAVGFYNFEHHINPGWSVFNFSSLSTIIFKYSAVCLVRWYVWSGCHDWWIGSVFCAKIFLYQLNEQSFCVTESCNLLICNAKWSSKAIFKCEMLYFQSGHLPCWHEAALCEGPGTEYLLCRERTEADGVRSFNALCPWLLSLQGDVATNNSSELSHSTVHYEHLNSVSSVI